MIVDIYPKGKGSQTTTAIPAIKTCLTLSDSVSGSVQLLHVEPLITSRHFGKSAEVDPKLFSWIVTLMCLCMCSRVLMPAYS